MKVTIIQTDPVWEAKQLNLESIDLLLSDADPDTKLFVLPEMFTTGFSMNAPAIAENMQGETVSWMKETAKKMGAALCGSLAISENDHYYNRLLFVKPDGSVCCYDKRHLHTLSGEHTVYSSGNKRVTCSYEGFDFNLQVCYDLRFPVWSRNRRDSDVIIYSANWPEARILAWKTLLVARAIENQCYVIGANRTGTAPDKTGYSGDSMIIDPIGVIKASSLSAKPCCITCDLEKEVVDHYRRSMPALDDADNFTIDF